MRKRFQRIGYVVLVIIVVISFMGCSLIPQSKPIEKPKPEKPVEKKPEKVQPKPVKPEPVKPKPVNPEPVKPKPVNPEPVNPEPVNPEPVNPEPKKPDVQSIIQEGKAYHAKGDLKKAIASFEQALKLEPENADAAAQLQETQDELKVSVDFHLKQGIKYFNQENLEDAMAEWNKALELDPDNKDALDYKARTQKQLDALGNK